MFSFADGYDGITSFSASECTRLKSLLLALCACVWREGRGGGDSILPFIENSQCLSTVKGILIASVSLVFRLVTIAKMQCYLNGNSVAFPTHAQNEAKFIWFKLCDTPSPLHMRACVRTSRYGIFGSYRFHQFTS